MLTRSKLPAVRREFLSVASQVASEMLPEIVLVFPCGRIVRTPCCYETCSMYCFRNEQLVWGDECEDNFFVGMHKEASVDFPYQHLKYSSYEVPQCIVSAHNLEVTMPDEFKRLFTFSEVGIELTCKVPHGYHMGLPMSIQACVWAFSDEDSQADGSYIEDFELPIKIQGLSDKAVRDIAAYAVESVSSND